MQIKRSVLYAVSTVLLWGAAAAIAKLMSQQNPYLVLLLSFLFAALAHFGNALRERAGSLASLWQSLRHIPLKWLLAGPFGYFVYWLGFLNSFRSYTEYSGTASETTILNYTWPIFTMIFFDALFEKKEQRQGKSKTFGYLGIACSFAGVYVLASEGRVFYAGNPEGILWGLLAGASYGFFSAYSRTVPEKDQGLFLFVAAACSAFMAALAVLAESLALGQIPGLDWKILSLAAVTGLLLDGLGYILWTKALSVSLRENVALSKITGIIYFLPLLSLLIVSVVFNEKKVFDQYFALASALVICGSVLIQKR